MKIFGGVVVLGVAMAVSACANGQAEVHDLTPLSSHSTVIQAPAEPVDGSKAVYRGGRDPRNGLAVDGR